MAGLNRGALSAQVVRLEDRVLLAGTNIVDLNTDTNFQNTSSHPTQFTEVNTVNGPRTFFTYNTPVTNKPILGVTQGTTATTTYIDLRFSPNTQLTSLIEYNGELYFFADDGIHGKELWKSDGTVAGTVMVRDIVGQVSNGATTTGFKNEGSNGAELVKSGGKLYFTASNDTTGFGTNRELWVTDGSFGGTFQVADINPGAGSSNPTQLTDVNGVLYFEATSGIATGRELWKYDPGTATASLVRDIRLGGQSSGITELTSAGSIVYFSANDGTHGYELWRSDGTTAGTFMVRDIQLPINGVNQGSNPSSLLFLNGELFFAADDGVVGKELWKSDGTEGGTTLVMDIAKTGPNGVVDVKQNSIPKNLTAVGNVIYFSANDGLTGRELWKFDTTNQVVPPSLVRDINTQPTSSGDSTASSYPGSLINVNGTLFFVASDTYTINGQTNFEIWRTDGTSAGTVLANTSTFDRNINQLGNAWQASPTGYVYPKSSADGLHPTEVIQDLSPDRFRTDANNKQLVLSNGRLYFAADNGFNGSTSGALGEYVPNFEPYTMNPVTGATQQLADLTIFSLTTSDPRGFTTIGTRTYFFFTDTRLISRTVGVAFYDTTTGAVTDVGIRFDNVGTAARPNPVALGGQLYFIAQGNELWRTNGTALGSTPVHIADASVDLLTLAGTRLFFRSDNNATGSELWTFDGNSASLVRDIGPVVNNTNTDAGITFIAPAGGSSVYFNANDNNVGSRLWISNGTNVNNGTRIAIPGAAAPGNVAGANGPANPTQIVSGNGIAYFVAGGQLYRSDASDAGTSAITVPPADPGPPTVIARTNFSNLTPVTGGLYFTAFNPVTGENELWFSTGATSSTATQVAGVTNATSLTAAQSRLYFISNGQLMRADAGVATSFTILQNVSHLTPSGTNLYFSANNGITGQELWFTDGNFSSQVPDTQVGGASSLQPTGVGLSRIHVGAGGRVFYAAIDTNLGNILHSTVGIAAPTAHPAAIKLQTADSNARGFIVLNNTVYFFTDLGPNRSILSGATTVTPGAGGMVITQFGNFSDGRTLTDTSAFNSQLDQLGEYLPGNNTNGVFRSNDTASATRAGTRFLFFTAVTGEMTPTTPSFQYGTELYVLMGGVPVRIGDIRVASQGNPNGNANPRYLTSIGNNSTGNATRIVFAANGTTGSAAGLWQFDTSQFANAQNTWQPVNITNAAVNPRYLVALGGASGKIYFTAGPENARTAWVTDGNTATQLSEAIVDESAGDGKIFGFANGNVYFSAREPGANTNFELYQTNLQTDATIQLKDINVGAAGSRPGNFTNVNGVLYFTANDGIHGFELWRSNGTEAGTVMVQDIEPGAAGSNPGVVITTTSVTVNGVTTTTTTYSYEGFAVANTRPDEFGVANSGAANSGANNGTPTLVFAATTSIYGRELWQVTPNTFSTTFNGVNYSGTAGTPQIVKDIAPGTRSSNPKNLTAIDGTVYFSADDGVSGDTLWRSIGMDQLTGNTETVRLHDDGPLFLNTSTVPPGTNGYRNPGNFTLLTTANTTLNRLLFTAANDIGGTELYNLAINHTPLTLNLTSNAVPENQPQGTLVGNFITTDPDPGDTFQYQFVAGAGDTDNSLFQIVGTSLQIRGVLDFETKSTYSVRIRTTDQRGQFFERAFTIFVSDQNDPPTGVDLTNVSSTIIENTVIPPYNPVTHVGGHNLGTIVAFDDAIDQFNTFYIDPASPDAASFDIFKDPVLGWQLVYIGASPDFETKQSYQIDILVDDPTVGVNPDAPAVTFTLFVIDVNDNSILPGSMIDSDTVNEPNQVPENSPFGTYVGLTAFAEDADTGLDTVTYSLTNSAGGRFFIDSLTGQVFVLNGNLLNYEAATSHDITVLAVSTDGSSDSRTFTINILDVNEFSVSGIIDTDPAPNQVFENSPTGTLVGITAFAVDNDGSNNVVTYSLASNASGRFQIDPVTGVISVLDGTLINREVAAQWHVLAKATSQDGSVSFQNFIINVLDVNEFPVSPIFDLNSAPEIIPENSPTGTPVGITAIAFDSDATNNQVTYSLFNTRQGRFAIDPNTGVVTVANGSLLNAEAQSSWLITVIATSQDGSQSTRDFTIQLSDVNEFAVGQVFDLDNTVNAVNENAANGTTVGITAFAIDLDVTASVSYSLLDNAGGRFTVHPTTGVVTVANGALLNREAPGGASHKITVQATSTDGSTSVKDFIIAVNDVNEFPVSPIQNLLNSNASTTSILEHSPIGSQVGVTAFASDDDATNNQVTYSLADNAGGRFSINPITGVVTVANSALLDREAAAFWDFTVRATSSDGGPSTTRTFRVNLIEVNDNPVSDIQDTNPAGNGVVGGITVNGNVNELAPTGTLVGITAFATDPDVGANGQITYSLQDTSGGRYKIDPVTGVVMVDDGTKIDFEAGVTNLIIVKATSGDGSFKTKSFTISVNDVYEEPELVLSNQSVNENMPSGTAIGAFGVLNATPNAPVYALVSGTGATNNGSFQIVGNQLRTKSSFNFEAKSSYSIRVRVTSSNGVTATKVFIITVNNVNEAPTGISLSSTSVKRTAPVGTTVGNLSGIDPDAAQTFTFALVPGTGSTDNAKFAIVGNQLRVNAPLGTGSRASIRVRVTDQNGLSFERTFTIRLTS